MDRGRGAAASRVLRHPSRRAASAAQLAQELVVGLGPAAHDGGQGVTDGPDVPGADAGAAVEVDRHDLARVGQADLVDPVHVEVARLGRHERAHRGPSARSSAAIRCSYVARRMWLM